MGKDLIRAATVRAQISQITQYNSAVAAFQNQFGGLPGDISSAKATAAGLTARGSCAGMGDGNGVIEGVSSTSCGNNSGAWQGGGETGTFWVDLSSAGGLNLNLIDQVFSTATPSTIPNSAVPYTQLTSYLPIAKLGKVFHVYVFSLNGNNYFGIANVTQLALGYKLVPSTSTNMSEIEVRQAYAIDSKIDDGLPQSGIVTAQFMTATGLVWAYTPWTNTSNTAYTTAITPSILTCYDNGNTSGVIETYSMTYNSGSSTTCGLAIQFQ